VLVLSDVREPWRTIELEGQRKTWAAANIPDVPVRFYYGQLRGPIIWPLRIASRGLRTLSKDSVYLKYQHLIGAWASRRPVRSDGDSIRTGVPENYVQTNAKLRATLSHLVSTDRFNYLLRTNTASYVDRKRLKEWVTTLPEERYYGGVILEKDGIPFVSGRGILMSRDVVEAAVADRDWQFGYTDDVALGHSMLRIGIKPQFIPRIDISSPDDIALDTLGQHHLVLCRCSERRSSVRREIPSEAARDVDLMRQVHSGYEAIASAI
jgi:hypothetical protein